MNIAICERLVSARCALMKTSLSFFCHADTHVRARDVLPLFRTVPYVVILSAARSRSPCNTLVRGRPTKSRHSIRSEDCLVHGYAW